MTSTLMKTLPQTRMPYLLRKGEGKSYTFGKQVVTIMADTDSTGGQFEMFTIAGSKGEVFPLHFHNSSYESLMVLEGRVELVIDGQYHLLTSGDYAHIPPGTKHAYRFAGHRNRIVSYSLPGNITSIFPVMGLAYSFKDYPPQPLYEWTQEDLIQAAKVADIGFEDGELQWGASQLVETGEVHGGVIPYVLESGEGDRLLTGDQLHRILASQKNTDGAYIFVSTEGPKGEPIVEHYHENHVETFYCVQGQMTMWANGEEIQLHEGDFLHVPEGTTHAYRLDAPYTRFVGMLECGLFEPFFRILGESYEHFIFPNEPGPLRMDRVMANMDTLDLKVVAQSPLHRN
ncbi:quercetin 2,3-dioxygenase [Paenibacillus sp. FSL K6-1318]|uniref:quercetin 2,3-dioxygenase n=1 Tax=Paenibacillus sp. FSL K6-1318 TaxID=2975291 RepID=UPI0030EF0A5C